MHVVFKYRIAYSILMYVGHSTLSQIAFVAATEPSHVVFKHHSIAYFIYHLTITDTYIIALAHSFITSHVHLGFGIIIIIISITILHSIRKCASHSV